MDVDESKSLQDTSKLCQYDADDLRRQEVGDGLDVDEQLARVEAADDWDPGHADGDQDQHEGTTNDQEFVV